MKAYECLFDEVARIFDAKRSLDFFLNGIRWYGIPVLACFIFGLDRGIGSMVDFAGIVSAITGVFVLCDLSRLRKSLKKVRQQDRAGAIAELRAAPDCWGALDGEVDWLIKKLA